MKIYIAGPMSGIEQHNIPAFFEVAAKLQGRGHEVVNPADNDGATLEEALDNEGHLGDWAAYMRVDIPRLCQCDGIYLMPNWQTSQGASLEQHVATALGMTKQGVNLFSESFMPPDVEPVVIGLSGYAQCGKDTVGQVLVEDYGFTRISFADKVREMVLQVSPSIRDIVSVHGWEEAKKQARVREVLQRVGMAVRRVIDEDAWVTAALRDLKPGGRYVITDVRFPNEVSAVWALDGKLVRITRAGIGPVNGHISESAIDDVLPDWTLVNDTSFVYLLEEVDDYMTELGFKRLPTDYPSSRIKYGSVRTGHQE